MQSFISLNKNILVFVFFIIGDSQEKVNLFLTPPYLLLNPELFTFPKILLQIEGFLFSKTIEFPKLFLLIGLLLIVPFSFIIFVLIASKISLETPFEIF